MNKIINPVAKEIQSKVDFSFAPKIRLRKHWIFGLVVVLFGNVLSLFTNTLAAQTYPVVHQMWLKGGENSDLHIDAFYTVVKCTSNSSDSVFVRVFNEKPAADTVDLDIVIRKPNSSDSVSYSLTLNLAIAEMAEHVCGSGLYNDLAFVLPTGYDPETAFVEIKIKK